jgi:hypothetical protein
MSSSLSGLSLPPPSLTSTFETTTTVRQLAVSVRGSQRDGVTDTAVGVENGKQPPWRCETASS